MNPLKALRDHRAHAEQVRPLGRPVARRPRPIFLPRQNHQRHAALRIFHAGVKDRHALALGKQPRHAAFRARRKLVAQPHVGKRSADHDFVIAAPRTVAVEVRRLHSMLSKILPRRPIGLDVARRRNVVRRHRVAQDCQHPRAHNVLHRRRRLGNAVKIRRLANVGRIRLPLVNVACRELQPLPVRVAIGNGRVLLAEAFARQPLLDRRGHLSLRRPNVLEEHRLPSLVRAQRIGVEVMPDLACKRVDHQRRRHQIIGTHVHIHAPLEVAIAAQHAHRNQSVLVDRL